MPGMGRLTFRFLPESGSGSQNDLQFHLQFDAMMPGVN